MNETIKVNPFDNKAAGMMETTRTITTRTGVFSERIGQQWCKPDWPSPYNGYVALQTTDGWVVLCWVDKIVSEDGHGDVILSPVKINELPKVSDG
jgi:hypothetical protein